VAKRFGAFGCTVLGVDLYPREDEHFKTMYPLSNLKDVLSQSDVTVLTLPLTEQTKYLMNADTLSALPQGAILVNIARGGVVHTESLLNALHTGALGGAVLDVFEEEPLSEDSPLWDMENVILTPHNSFVGEGNGERLFGTIVRNLKEV
jgi:phosphoglycerate dehydrogenase-like enzyme